MLSSSPSPEVVVVRDRSAKVNRARPKRLIPNIDFARFVADQATSREI